MIHPVFRNVVEALDWYRRRRVTLADLRQEQRPPVDWLGDPDADAHLAAAFTGLVRSETARARLECLLGSVALVDLSAKNLERAIADRREPALKLAHLAATYRDVQTVLNSWATQIGAATRRWPDPEPDLGHVLTVGGSIG